MCPDAFLDFSNGEIPFQRAHVRQQQLAIQMVDLVSDAPRLEASHIQDDLRSTHILPPQNNVFSPSNLKRKAGHAKAAFPSLLLALRKLDHRVGDDEPPGL